MIDHDVDIQPVLEDKAFRIRPLLLEDQEGLYQAASDPLIWEQHPARNRHERSVFDPYFHAILNAGGGLVFETIDGNRIVGCSRYYLHPALGS